MFPLGPDPTAPPPVAMDPVLGLPTLGSVLRSAPEPPAQPVPASRRGSGADAALAELLAGNARFLAGGPRYGHAVSAARAAAADPTPFAVVIGCMDSRVPVEAVLDQDFGALFTVRTAGHVLDRAALASVEICVLTQGVGLVMVLGHRRCAAVAATVRAWHTGELPHGFTRYVVEDIGAAIDELGGPGDEERVIRRHTDLVASRLRGTLGSDVARVVGAYYDVDTGAVILN